VQKPIPSSAFLSAQVFGKNRRGTRSLTCTSSVKFNRCRRIWNSKCSPIAGAPLVRRFSKARSLERPFTRVRSESRSEIRELTPIENKHCQWFSSVFGCYRFTYAFVVGIHSRTTIKNNAFSLNPTVRRRTEKCTPGHLTVTKTNYTSDRLVCRKSERTRVMFAEKSFLGVAVFALSSVPTSSQHPERSSTDSHGRGSVLRDSSSNSSHINKPVTRLLCFSIFTI